MDKAVDDELHVTVDEARDAEGAKPLTGGRPKTVKSIKKTGNSDTTFVMVVVFVMHVCVSRAV